MKVLFIGGSGVISSAVSKLAVEKGIELFLLNRGHRSELIPPNSNLIKGDIRDLDTVAGILSKNRFDVVVDWIGFIPEHIETDIKLFSGRVMQYIYISSASVYQKPASHYIITESTPLANPYWEYSRNKIACEERLLKEYRENGFPITIVRPSLTYGNTMIPAAINSWAHPWTIVDRMIKGRKVIVQGDGTSLWTMTHNTDFARGFTGLIGNYQAIGHPFHITSDEVLTWDQIIKMIGIATGVEPRIIHIPSDFIGSVVPEWMGGLLGDKSGSTVFDNSKIKRFVPGFAAEVPFLQGVSNSIQWFKEHPEHMIVDERYNNLMDCVIDAYERK